ncbi:MAG: tetratricopeptide repeat protein [Bryobacteraceae bacterium]|jgi:tetratricopeptide (TPR) repeat protein
MRAISALFLLAALSAQGQEDPLAQGIAAFNQGQFTAALASLEKAPDTPPRRVFLALTRAGLGHCDAAQSELAAQFDQNIDFQLRRLAGLALAQCRMTSGHYDEALPVLARLKSLYPADADVLYQTARLHMQAWNDTLFEMFQKTPGSFRVNQVSAEIFEIQGRYAEAAAEYRKAIEKNPAALNLHFRLGRVLLIESHAPENMALARQAFEAELALNPGDAVAEYEIGQILLTGQQTAEAVRRFEHAAALSPDFPEALEALAKARMDAKQYPEAIALLEKVVHLQPANEPAHYSLMMAYRNAGRPADAAREQGTLDKLQRAPEGEFTDFLKRLGEKAPKP